MPRELEHYLDYLAGCRFCPMCKPASEVGNLTRLESHTTRYRAVLLWRFLRHGRPLGSRERELIYQSTLDSISQSWCVNGYPVSEYVLAARRMLFLAGELPDPVRGALRRPEPMERAGAFRPDAVFLASEITENGAWELLEAGLQALDAIGLSVLPLPAESGALPYCLGDWEQAAAQGRRVVEAVKESGACWIIVDGPQTLWALRRIYPEMGLALPEGTIVVSLAERLGDAIGAAGSPAARRAAPGPDTGKDAPAAERGAPDAPVFFHDSRSALFLGDEPARPRAIQPGFGGDEAALGRGEIYDRPRKALAGLGMNAVYSVWSRSLARSCGADDGLQFTYPGLAAGLARQRVAEARDAGARAVVSDSPSCVVHMRRTMMGSPERGDLPIQWLPEILAGRLRGAR